MAARGLFGVAPYSAYHRRDGSSVRGPVSTPQPPRQPFLTTSDPSPAVYQARPTRDASDTFAVNIKTDISTLGVKRFFTTDIPVPAYRTVITMIRGRASAAVAPNVTPPAPEWFTTDPYRPAIQRSDDRIFPPLFGAYDPLGSGAFFATPVPWRGRYPWADASDLFVAAAPPGPTLGISQRVFATLLSYQSPHRQEGSLFVVTPATFGGISSVVPLELRRFFTNEWARRVGPSYAFDASWFGPSQNRILIPPPAPTFHGRKITLWLRRLEMLQLRPHVAEE